MNEKWEDMDYKRSANKLPSFPGWERLGWKEITKKGDAWIFLGGGTIHTTLPPVLSQLVGSQTWGIIVGEKLYNGGLREHYEIWRKSGSGQGNRLPLNKIFSKKLPLP